MDIYTSDNNKDKYKAHEYLKQEMPNISLLLRKVLNNLPIKKFSSNNLNCNFDIYSEDDNILSKIKDRLNPINQKGYIFHHPFYCYFRPQRSIADIERKMFITDDSNNLNY